VGVPPVSADPSPTVPPPRLRLRAPRNLAGGLGLAAIAAVALWSTGDLATGTLRSMGPGALPRGVAVLLLGAGLVLATSALLRDGPALDRWSLRGPLCVSAAVILFALTIRRPGLAVAGPLVVFVGGLATPEARPVELAVLSLVLTGFCVGLFRYALGLPIPVLVIPDVIVL
jgi:putative tricarboxylic transport membrane protein